MLGKLPHGEDFVKTIEDFCVQNSIQTGVFSAIGAVMSVTLGSYDQNQQVYFTFRKEGPLEYLKRSLSLSHIMASGDTCPQGPRSSVSNLSARICCRTYGFSHLSPSIGSEGFHP